VSSALGSDDAARIARAARFERWQEVLDLSRGFQLRRLSELPALVEILNSCVALKCGRSGRDFKSPIVADEPLRQFVDAWMEFAGVNPAAAKQRFRALADDRTFGWLGMYGLLAYAIEAENAELLRMVLLESEAISSKPEPLVQKIAAARLTLATLRHDYAGLMKLLESAETNVPEQVRMPSHVAYLIWSDQLNAARARIDKYIAVYGLDHDAVRTDVDLRLVLEPPSRLRSLVDARLKNHPNYWTLRIVKGQLLLESGVKENDKTLATELNAVPQRLAYARLARFQFLARETRWFANELIKNLNDLSSKYEDYPLFSVTAANALIWANDIDAAIERLDKADRQTYTYFPATTTRARLASKAGRYSEAVEISRTNLDLAPNDVFAKLFLAQSLVLARDFKTAQRLIDEIRKSKRYVPKDELDFVEQTIKKSK